MYSYVSNKLAFTINIFEKKFHRMEAILAANFHVFWESGTYLFLNRFTVIFAILAGIWRTVARINQKNIGH